MIICNVSRFFTKIFEGMTMCLCLEQIQSNDRAESAVMSAKRILKGNINPVTGELSTDVATQAILTHRNTPLHRKPEFHLWCHYMDVHSRITCLHQRSCDKNGWRSRTLERKWWRRCKRQACERKFIIPLQTGDSVHVQNQLGNRPKKWQRTGTIIEKLPHRQYRVLVYGSRRVSCHFLRKIDPKCRMPAASVAE